MPVRDRLRRTSVRLVLIGAVGLGLAAPLPAVGQSSPGEDLDRVERQLRQSEREAEKQKQAAAKLAKESAEIKQKLVAAAAEAQAQEEKLSVLETKVADLERQRDELRNALRRRDAQTARVLASLERLAFRPTVALVAQPLSPADSVRSAILMRGALPRIERSAKDLRNQLVMLSTLKGEIASQRESLVAVSTALAAKRIELQELMAQKADRQKAAESKHKAAAARAAKLAERADSLRDLVASLAAKAPPPPPDAPPTTVIDSTTAGVQTAAVSVSFASRKGKLPFPAAGRVVQKFGQRNDVGFSAKGIVLETRPAARVVSPHGGEVAFAGPFRRYGHLLIIEHGDGYHTLLAGMEHIDVGVGHRLLPGEPVGVMEASGKPKLYLEVRRNGDPIDPLPWFTRNKGTG